MVSVQLHRVHRQRLDSVRRLSERCSVLLALGGGMLSRHEATRTGKGQKHTLLRSVDSRVPWLQVQEAEAQVRRQRLWGVLAERAAGQVCGRRADGALPGGAVAE